MEPIVTLLIGLLQSEGWGPEDHRFQFFQRMIRHLDLVSENKLGINKSYVASSDCHEELIRKLQRLKLSNVEILSTDDLDDLYKMDVEAFGMIPRQYGSGKDLFKSWYELSDKSFALVKDQDNLFGYCIVFPMNLQTFQEYKSGKLSLYQFDKVNFESNSKGNDKKFIYIHSVYLKPKYRNSKVTLKLINAIIVLIGRFINEKKVAKNVLFTEATSRLGKGMINHFGLLRSENDTSLDGNPIYHLDFEAMDNYDEKSKDLDNLKKST